MDESRAGGGYQHQRGGAALADSSGASGARGGVGSHHRVTPVAPVAPVALMTPEEYGALEALVPQLERIRAAAGAMGALAGRMEEAAQHGRLTDDERTSLAEIRVEMMGLAAELEAIERRLDLGSVTEGRDAA